MDTSPRPPERTQPRLGGFRPVKIGASASSGVTRPAGVPRPASAPVRPMHAESPRKSPSAEPVAKISFPAETEPFRPAAPATASAPASTSARNVGTGKVPPPLPASSPAAAPASTFNAPAAKAAAPVIISQPILFTQAAKPTPPAIPRQSPAGRLDLETSSALATRAGSTTVLLSTAMSQELMAQAAEMLSAEQRRPKGTAGSIQNRRQALKNPFSEPSAMEMMPPATAAMIEEDTFVKVKPPTSFSNETKPQAFPQPLPASKGQQVQAQTPLFPPLVQASTRLGKPAFQRANASLPPAVTRAFVAPAGPNGTVVLPREIAPAAPVPPSAAVTGTIPTVAPSSGAVSAKTFPPLPAMTSGQISTQTIPVKSMRDMSHAFDTAAAISEVLATASGSGSAAATDALRKMEADKHAQNAELAAIAAAEAANAEAVIATEKAAESETTLIFSEEAEDTEPTQKLSDAVAFTDVPVQAVVTVTSPAPVIAAVPAIIPEPEVVKIAAAPAPVAIVQTVPAPAPVVVKQARVLPPTYIMAAPVPAAVVPAPESEQQKSEVNFTETKKESAQSDAMPLPIPVFPPMAEQIQELEHKHKHDHEYFKESGKESQLSDLTASFLQVDLLPPAPAPAMTFPDFRSAPSPAPLRLSGLKQSTAAKSSFPMPAALPSRSGSHVPLSASLRPQAKAPARSSATRSSLFDPRPEDDEVPIPPFQPHRVKGLSGGIGTVRPVQKFGLSMLFVSMAGAVEDLTIGVVRRKTASLTGLKLDKEKDRPKTDEKKAEPAYKARTSKDMDLLTRRANTTPAGAHRGARPATVHGEEGNAMPAHNTDDGVLGSAPQFASMASTEEFDAMSIIGAVAATGAHPHSLSLSNSTSTAAIALQTKGMDKSDKGGAHGHAHAGAAHAHAQTESVAQRETSAAPAEPAPIHPAHLLLSGLALAAAALVLKAYLYELTGSMAMWMDAAFTVLLAASISTSLLVWIRRDVELPSPVPTGMSLESLDVMPRSEIYYIDEPDIDLPQRGFIQYPAHAAAIALMIITCLGACLYGLSGAHFTIFQRLHDMTQTFPAAAPLVSAFALVAAQLMWWGYCRSMAATHSSYRPVLETAWLQVHASVAAALGVTCLTRSESYADTALALFVLALMLRAAWLLFARQVKIVEELC